MELPVEVSTETQTCSKTPRRFGDYLETQETSPRQVEVKS